MKFFDFWWRRPTAGCLVMILAAPLANAAANQPQQLGNGLQSQKASSAADESQMSSDQADKGTARSAESENYPDSPAPAGEQTANQTGQAATPQSAPDPQQNGAQKPVGTAAAPYEKPSGVAASRQIGRASCRERV